MDSPAEIHTGLHQTEAATVDYLYDYPALLFFFLNTIYFFLKSYLKFSQSTVKHVLHLTFISTSEHPKTISGIFMYKDWLLVASFWVYLGTVQLSSFAGTAEILCRYLL